MRWLEGHHWLNAMSLSKLRELVMDREAWHAVVLWGCKGSDMTTDWTELNWTSIITVLLLCCTKDLGVLFVSTLCFSSYGILIYHYLFIIITLFIFSFSLFFFHLNTFIFGPSSTYSSKYNSRFMFYIKPLMAKLQWYICLIIVIIIFTSWALMYSVPTSKFS